MRFTDNRGASAVEFAIILPLLLMILFGIIEFSIIFYDKAMITNASREGARLGIVFRQDRDAGTEDAEIESVVNGYLTDKLITFGSSVPAAIEIDREGFDTGDSLTVRVSYLYDFLIVPNLVNTIAGPINLTGTTVMKME